jgi:hypothetical protein
VLAFALGIAALTVAVVSSPEIVGVILGFAGLVVTVLVAWDARRSATQIERLSARAGESADEAKAAATESLDRLRRALEARGGLSLPACQTLLMTLFEVASERSKAIGAGARGEPAPKCRLVRPRLVLLDRDRHGRW